MARPTAISTTPMARISTAGLSGSRLTAIGLKYAAQSARRLKNLSSPARKAAAPRPIRKPHQAEFSLLSRLFIVFLLPYGVADARKVTCNLLRPADSLYAGGAAG